MAKRQPYPPAALGRELETLPFVRERRDVVHAKAGHLLRIAPGGAVVIPRSGQLVGGTEPFPEEAIVLGRWANTPIAVVEVPCDDVATSGCACGVRELLATLSAPELALISTALEVLHWRRDHRFCGRCGHTTAMDEYEYAMRCTACGHVCYPRLSPCIIALVSYGDDMLLARGPHFPAGRFSTLAGFIEPGESAEQAVRREIREEVGADVHSLVFQRSQSWPFPHAFMLGFTAQAASRDITIDGVEIEAADWFGVDMLPELPPKGAISRWLIDQHIEAVRQRRRF